MKKNLEQIAHYIGWITLGILVSFIVHTVIELPILLAIINDYATYSYTWLWQNWDLAHVIGTITLLVLGIAIGVWFGRRDWFIKQQNS